ncbi:MAG TPA: hypothetical protein VFV67_08590 [Actinophytocola sp.]|uniref:hypothetical protein n=1 Tax=Actinophytocola sp. TaxID=1872138 RepID=UPI002DB7A4E3|nr:hypothetical protein [Actinophytocola sp.]HEU5470698.1 hypothetical protein [Actinophytocola sp.]
MSAVSEPSLCRKQFLVAWVERQRRIVLRGILLLVCANILGFTSRLLYLVPRPELRDQVQAADWVVVGLALPAALVIVWVRFGRSGSVLRPRLLGYAGLLVVACAGAGFVTAPPSGDGAVLGSAAVVAALWLPPVLSWLFGRRAKPAAPSRPAPGSFRGRAEPAPGHVWFAEVPFDDVPGAKDRPCLVVRTFAHHAEVLKITSVDKRGRSEYVRIPTATWDRRADRDSWLELPRCAHFPTPSSAAPRDAVTPGSGARSASCTAYRSSAGLIGAGAGRAASAGAAATPAACGG